MSDNTSKSKSKQEEGMIPLTDFLNLQQQLLEHREKEYSQKKLIDSLKKQISDSKGQVSRLQNIINRSKQKVQFQQLADANTKIRRQMRDLQSESQEQLSAMKSTLVMLTEENHGLTKRLKKYDDIASSIDVVNPKSTVEIPHEANNGSLDETKVQSETETSSKSQTTKNESQEEGVPSSSGESETQTDSVSNPENEDDEKNTPSNQDVSENDIPNQPQMNPSQKKIILGLKVQISNAEDQINTLTSQLIESKKTIESLTVKVSKETAEKNTLLKQNDKVISDVKIFKNKLKDLESKFKESQTSLSRERNSASTFHKELMGLKAQHSKLKSSHNSLQSKLTSTKKTLDEKLDLIKRMRNSEHAKRKQEQQEKETLQNKISDLESNFTKTSAQLSAVQAQFDTISADNSSLGDNLFSYKTTIKNLEEEKTQLSKSLNEVTLELQQSNDICSSHSQRISGLETCLSDTNQAFNEYALSISQDHFTSLQTNTCLISTISSFYLNSESLIFQFASDSTSPQTLFPLFDFHYHFFSSFTTLDTLLDRLLSSLSGSTNSILSLEQQISDLQTEVRSTKKKSLVVIRDLKSQLKLEREKAKKSVDESSISLKSTPRSNDGTFGSRRSGNGPTKSGSENTKHHTPPNPPPSTRIQRTPSYSSFNSDISDSSMSRSSRSPIKSVSSSSQSQNQRPPSLKRRPSTSGSFKPTTPRTPDSGTTGTPGVVDLEQENLSLIARVANYQKQIWDMESAIAVKSAKIKKLNRELQRKQSIIDSLIQDLPQESKRKYSALGTPSPTLTRSSSTVSTWWGTSTKQLQNSYQKLQAVFEEQVLKNIALGKEIEMLKKSKSKSGTLKS